MIRLGFAVLALSVLVACGAGRETPLPAGKIDSVAYTHPGPPSITLISVINNRTGAGGHTALLVSGSQRVLFDPAGSVRAPWVVEQGDVLFTLPLLTLDDGLVFGEPLGEPSRDAVLGLLNVEHVGELVPHDLVEVVSPEVVADQRDHRPEADPDRA